MGQTSQFCFATKQKNNKNTLHIYARGIAFTYTFCVLHKEVKHEETGIIT